MRRALPFRAMNPASPSRPLAARIARILAVTVVACFLVLLPLALPPGDPVVPPAPEGARPFVWARDSLWNALESRFAAARERGCADSLALRRDLAAFDGAVTRLGAVARVPEDPEFDVVESAHFALAARVAACGAALPAFARATTAMRTTVKRLSIGWDPNRTASRDRLYRALYGGRAALEEAMLQQPGAVGPLLLATDEPSAAPSVEVEGVRVRSGDLLVSRGGYPTSALIARGNDYPGNFSHVALVHVDSASGRASVIEAHIELGVKVATAAQYLADKKLRVMVLRPRADLAAVQARPLLGHRAAQAMLDRSAREHIPYDFEMDYADATKLFCSEIASQGYRGEQVELWMGRSTISRPGLRQWLASFGVTHFETQEPSDLEYDPQLVAVAEWRDPATLFEDHVANAVTDAMLDEADAGRTLTYPWYELPLARALKGWSWMKERFGGVGPIPEGMAPASALRNRGYGARHAALVLDVMQRANDWAREKGYRPPYWVLVQLARAAVSRSAAPPSPG